MVGWRHGAAACLLRLLEVLQRGLASAEDQQFVEALAIELLSKE